MDIRKKLLNQRLERHIKAKKVAKYIGISPVSLSRYENGRTELKFEHLQRYAEFLGFEIKLLLKD
jgi:transcriptional regulator with XRE-family HTH domain